MKDIHIPTIEELLSSEPEFNIEELSDGYRISGIQYRGKTCTYDLGTKLLPSKTKFEHAEHAHTALSTEYRAASLPLFHAICKTLYQNRKGKQKELVEKARTHLNSALISAILTLSEVDFRANDKHGIAYHDLRLNSQYFLLGDIAGPEGFITDPITQADKACKALLDDDDLQEINNTYRWMIGRSMYIIRRQMEEEITEVYGVSIKAMNNTFFIDTLSPFNINLPALGVRLVK